MKRRTGRSGRLARAEGHYDKAASLLREALELVRGAGDRRAIMLCLTEFARVAFDQGALQRAARLLGATVALRQTTDVDMFASPSDQADYTRVLSALQTAPGDDVFAAAWAEGRAMTLEQAINDALSLRTDNQQP